MERVISTEERIRRAEQIYLNRKQSASGVRVEANKVNSSKKSISLFKKLILQIFICMTIYFIFYLVQNSNYFFSEEVISKTKEILTYDINFNQIYNNINSYINSLTNKNDNSTQNVLENNIGGAADKQAEESISQIQEDANNVIQQEGTNNIENTQTEDIKTEETVEDTTGMDQMTIDSIEIKKKVTMIKPLQATVSSRFGIRNPTTATVPKYHTGIDLAANTGTKIIAAMEGTVTMNSSQGDYRKSYKNRKWRHYDYICAL